MRNFIQSGDVMTVTVNADTVSGDVVATGKLVGVAAISANAGEEAEVALTGVFDVPKATGSAWSQGAPVYWDGAAATATASGNDLMGHAFVEAASAATIGRVRLAR
ncbi:DUF2190 family protein [Jiella sp. M17.18]